MNLTRTATVALLSGIAGFVLAALLHAYPKVEVTRHRYCIRCAAHEETFDKATIMGGVSGYKEYTGPLHQIVGAHVGPHEHQFTPWATIFPTRGVELEHPEVARVVLQLQHLENSAHSVALLDQASRQDPARTTRLVQRLLMPQHEAPTSAALRALDRDAPWPERWAAIDALLAKG